MVPLCQLVSAEVSLQFRVHALTRTVMIVSKNRCVIKFIIHEAIQEMEDLQKVEAFILSQ
jgi:hypothetical protein